jgi:putative membrane protein insertion efficiency factor
VIAATATRGLVRAYQVMVRPLLVGQCRYVPTCSEYALQAIESHGALRGGWLAFKRVCRCHPLGGSGLDPVPQQKGTPFRRSEK